MQVRTHFGFKDVKTEEKQGLVKGVFDSVATKYDIMNDVMSLGIHRLWKDYTIKHSTAKSGDKILDIAGGTGDLAKKFNQIVGNTGKVVLADINNAMLSVGRDNLVDEGISDIEFVQTNAEHLAFRDNSFDLISMAFGLRNVTDKQQALNDFYRTLKPGGILLILEFSKLENDFLAKVYDEYSFKILPKMGKIIAGDEESYQYLAESIRKHPNQETLKDMIKQAGFSSCEYHNLSGGIVALHKAVK
jgi:demethylmenaquinone methyltransferase/2-methoxy-6-polyprenyl-1,4-benzoquinol methylase